VPESRDLARRLGPATARQVLVTVTEADLARAAQAFVDLGGDQPIRRALAISRWTGSWLRTTVTVEPMSGELDAGVRSRLQAFLDAHRLVGTEIVVVGPSYVPIDLAIAFDVRPGFDPLNVQPALRQALGSAELAEGRLGFFHPANFDFGDPVFVSRLHAVALATPGVQSIRITRLARHAATDADGETAANLARGQLAVAPDQIIRLDDNPAAPQHGTLVLQVLQAQARGARR
jgi:hypothetical protein